MQLPLEKRGNVFGEWDLLSVRNLKAEYYNEFNCKLLRLALQIWQNLERCLYSI